MSITDQLEEERHIINNATAGPWEFQPWSKYTLPSGEYAESILLANASPDGEITREMSDEDGEFCAHARTALPLRNAQVEAVLAKCSELEATDNIVARAFATEFRRAIEEAGA